MARGSASNTLWRTQNFLRDPSLARRLVDRSDIRPEDVVYDLGAGGGVLTAALARRAARVVAIEKDGSLAARLRARFSRQRNVAVRHADLLEHPLPRAEYVVFANPPFDITSALIGKLTTAAVPPRVAYLGVQREAARRYLGHPRQTLAALLIAPWFRLRVVHRFARTDFVPAPSVDVVMVRLTKRGPPLVEDHAAQLYRDFVVSCFAGWDPSIGRSLARAVGARVSGRLLGAAGVAPGARPSGIALDGWLRMFREFARLPGPIRRSVAGAEQRLRRQQRRLHKLHRTRAPRDALAGLPAPVGEAYGPVSSSVSASIAMTYERWPKPAIAGEDYPRDPWPPERAPSSLANTLPLA